MIYGPSWGSYEVDLLANAGFGKTKRLETTLEQSAQWLNVVLKAFSEISILIGHS